MNSLPRDITRSKTHNLTCCFIQFNLTCVHVYKLSCCICCVNHVLTNPPVTLQNETKIAQSNFRKAVLYRKLLIGYNVVRHICPKIIPSCGSIPKPNCLPHSCSHSTYHPKPHTYPITHFATMQWREDTHRDMTETVGGNGRCM